MPALLIGQRTDLSRVNPDYPPDVEVQRSEIESS